MIRGLSKPRSGAASQTHRTASEPAISDDLSRGPSGGGSWAFGRGFRIGLRRGLRIGLRGYGRSGRSCPVRMRFESCKVDRLGPGDPAWGHLLRFASRRLDTCLDRWGSQHWAKCTRNQSWRPILRPFVDHGVFRMRSVQSCHAFRIV